jgi:CBS domain-containing membrane protein
MILPTKHNPTRVKRWATHFKPMLAGATLRDRLIACIGALFGIAVTALVCRVTASDLTLPFLVAPIGASAVLLFAVPASPLAQPWSIVGGNTVSALIGIAMAKLVTDPALAAGLAVALAIGGMSLARCLHPPGGAVALTTVMGGPSITAAGFGFAFLPVAVNSIILVVLGWLFHKLSRHTYPHRPEPAAANVHKTDDTPAPQRVGFQSSDIDAALADLGETFDIGRKDLDRVLRQVEMRALIREHGSLRCADIMSKDLIFVEPSEDVETARRLLLKYSIRTLPVVDRGLVLLGTVGLRNLVNTSGPVGDVMTPAATAQPDSPAMAQLGTLTDGVTHAILIVDNEHRVIGLISQTDMLAALGRMVQTLPKSA